MSATPKTESASALASALSHLSIAGEELEYLDEDASLVVLDAAFDLVELVVKRLSHDAGRQILASSLAYMRHGAADLREAGAEGEGVVSDQVNHPKHYTSHPSGIECIDVVEHMTFSVGNAIKYLWRAGLKGAAIEDLEKARWYIDREIQRLRKAAS